MRRPFRADSRMSALAISFCLIPLGFLRRFFCGAFCGTRSVGHMHHRRKFALDNNIVRTSAQTVIEIKKCTQRPDMPVSRLDEAALPKL